MRVSPAASAPASPDPPSSPGQAGRTSRARDRRGWRSPTRGPPPRRSRFLLRPRAAPQLRVRGRRRAVPEGGGARSPFRHGVLGRGDDAQPRGVDAAGARRGPRRLLRRLGATPGARLAQAPTARSARLPARRRDPLRPWEPRRSATSAMPTPWRRSIAAIRTTSTPRRSMPSLSSARRTRGATSRSTCARRRCSRRVLPTHPRHPGVLHYLIHSYDDPIHAPLGLRAARVYGGVAPGCGHALHAASHIFVALGWWDDVIAANERAVTVVAATVPTMGRGRRAAATTSPGSTMPTSRSAASTPPGNGSTPVGG